MMTGLFQSCGHCWVFQIFWHIECSNFTASSFRSWNSSVGIPSPPLALFVTMLPVVHLTSHSRMSGSRLVITPLWLSGSWRSFYPAIYLGPNYGRGNEDSGDLPQKTHACTATVHAPSPATGHHRPKPLPETPGHPQASLLWGHCSFLLGPGAQGPVVPSKSLFPSPM